MGYQHRSSELECTISVLSVVVFVERHLCSAWYIRSEEFWGLEVFRYVLPQRVNLVGPVDVCLHVLHEVSDYLDTLVVVWF